MQFCFDWISFTVKPDRLRREPYHIYLNEVFNLLCIPESVRSSFLENDKGAHRNYDHSYSFKGITIYTLDFAESYSFRKLTDSQREKYYTYGFNVEIKGTGCRYFEGISPHGEDCYRFLFHKLLERCAKGCALNICRLDIAFDSVIRHGDNREQLLNLDRIDAARNSKYDDSCNPSYTSLYRTSREVCSYDNASRFNIDTGLIESYKAKGRSIYFGSFESDSFCRFYDKKAEQETMRKSDLTYLRDELASIDSWVRLEFVFKNAIAMKLVNAYVYMNKVKFLRFLTETINYYLRFTVPDATRATNCSIVSWWAEFIETCNHSKIKVDGLSIDEFASSFKWTLRCANTFNAIIDNIGLDAFLTSILNAADRSQYSAKQRRIAESESRADDVYCNFDLWVNNIPKTDY